MPKFFVVSDTHGFCTLTKKVLDEAGFEQDNPDHWIIHCGDILDRGSEAQDMIDFMMGLERKILVKGNHEILMMELIERGFPGDHDWHNGTAQSTMQLAPDAKTWPEACPKVKSIVEQLFSQQVNFFETQNYVFVHSQIPYWLGNGWRDGSDEEWADAMWGNPFDFWESVEIEGKTVCFGHWHTSYYNSPLNEFSENSDYGIAYGDGFIGLDACTVYSNKVNVLVIEDEFLEEI